MYYCIVLLLFSLTNGNIFSTSLGQCTMKIYDGKINDIPELVNIIEKEANKLIYDFGLINPQPFSIYITNNLIDFKKLSGPIPEWGIAVAKMHPNRIIMQSPSTAKISYVRFKEVLIHELNHIYMFHMSKYGSIPSWFKEGMAMHSSGEFSLLHKIEISHSIWKNNLFSLRQLKNINIYNNKIQLAYGESAASIDALIYYYGENVLFNIFTNLHQGKEFEPALEIAINENLFDFQIKFERFLEENYYWVFLFKTRKYIYVILPIILVLGFIYKNYKNKKILKLWELEEELENQ